LTKETNKSVEEGARNEFPRKGRKREKTFSSSSVVYTSKGSGLGFLSDRREGPSEEGGQSRSYFLFLEKQWDGGDTPEAHHCLIREEAVQV